MNQRRAIGWSICGGVAASTAIVACTIAVLIYFDMQLHVVRLLEWIEARGIWAPILFALVVAAVVVLLLPGALFTTGAGFVFGIVTGTLCVVIGTTLGAVVAFLIARRLFGARAASYILKHPKLQLLDAEFPTRAWRIVLFTRLIPLFPAKLANYFFGLTSVSLRAFTLGTLIGIIPLSAHSVYLGAIAAALTTQSIRSDGYSSTDWLLYGAGLVVAICAVIYLGHWGWRALHERQVE